MLGNTYKKHIWGTPFGAITDWMYRQGMRRGSKSVLDWSKHPDRLNMGISLGIGHPVIPRKTSTVTKTH